jgi:hypothetical protein
LIVPKISCPFQQVMLSYLIFISANIILAQPWIVAL